MSLPLSIVNAAVLGRLRLAADNWRFPLRRACPTFLQRRNPLSYPSLLAARGAELMAGFPNRQGSRVWKMRSHRKERGFRVVVCS